ncbi:MAG: hypothetical protein KZQ95_01215 [Candidatus Thiodiazotropha sp. (ex Epidulcina cf. delphinae)]|nr:hypothetical protein [Candidatus Thiodiazotropha sp. (ex Epidulcina cf. delphinae)]
MRSYTVKMVLVILLSVNIGISVANENPKHQLKLDTITKLINASSVSKNILNSGNDVAIQYYNLAKVAYKSAVIEFEKGDINKSNLFIKKATDALSDATMFANMDKGNVNVDADRHLYEETKESVDALLLAVHRVAKEKGVDESKEMLDKINTLNQQAQDHASKNMYSKAIQEMEQILALIRGNIIELKMGDTLVRTLSFANPKEEYRYEVDRNDAHFMLLRTFVESADGGNAYLEDKQLAHQLRKKAEIFAKSKDYENAISTLEKSTQILIRVIRMTGLKIPG